MDLNPNKVVNMKNKFIIYLILAIALGLGIAWIDSRPHWDDTGISVFMIAASATLCGYLASQKPWLIALAVSAWIPLWGIALTHNYGALLAFVPGFAGAYVGYWLKMKLPRR
jgi:hypothetical protein